MSKYICLFEESGKRYTTIVEGIHFKDDEGKKAFISKLESQAKEQGIDKLIEQEVSVEDFNTLIGNKGQGDNGTGYIWDFEQNKPVSAPARVVTLEEKLSGVRSTYVAKISEIDSAMQIAKNNNDQEYIAELQTERQNVINEYSTALEEYNV